MRSRDLFEKSPLSKSKSPSEKNPEEERAVDILISQSRPHFLRSRNMQKEKEKRGKSEAPLSP